MLMYPSKIEFVLFTRKCKDSLILFLTKSERYGQLYVFIFKKKKSNNFHFISNVSFALHKNQYFIFDFCLKLVLRLPCQDNITLEFPKEIKLLGIILN